MKNALFVALLAFGLMACNNSSKESSGISSATEQTTMEVDSLGSIITAESVGSLKLGARIPDTISGCEVIFIIYEKEDGSENAIVDVKKDGKRILQLRPGIEDEEDATKDFIAGILVTSDQFATAEGIHVGSSIHDIMKKQDATTYFNGKRVFVKDNGLTYFLKPEDYEGELPTGSVDNPVKIEQPTFKADAQIKLIGVYMADKTL